MPKIIHNDWKNPLFRKWCHIKSRCLYKKNQRYSRYGGRGIKMCDEWLNSFIAFRNWSYDNGYKEGLTIDRIDNDGDYEPNNCRWVLPREQYLTRSTSIVVEKDGIKKTINDWCKELNICSGTIYDRIKRLNMNPYDAIFVKPIRKRAKNGNNATHGTSKRSV